MGYCNARGGIEIYRIGEISEKIGLSVRSLRYYDKIGLLTPSFKNENGFRYYSEDDLAKCQKIAVLKVLGFTSKEIEKILESGDIKEELEHQESLIANKIEHLTLIRKSIEIARNRMETHSELPLLIADLKKVFKGYIQEFHDKNRTTQKTGRPNKKHNKKAHIEVFKLLRKIASEKDVRRDDYIKLLKQNPRLRNSHYFSKYFVMLRLSKSNKFKLDEIDTLEKNIKKFIKSLDSDIV
ncbi:MerR family transcriptional regulator [uncultured Ilyobacter sp.]|uniref:MerR family transcriptional regulator n=1 Tax=uncultured Ilyobacter sp. TaxID=544433 RepID=UPI0029C9146E|nr:MerR family transcriptional regulator [uncultured Ilyobacter sp.]